MERILLTNENVEECAARAAEVLRAGGIVLYPTDTVYGLGVDAFSDSAVATLYALKGREALKTTHAIVSNMEMIEVCAEIDELSRNLIARYMPGPLTLVLNKKAGIVNGIARDRSTIGLRMPNNSFCTAMTEAFGGPVTTTSANRSGETPLHSITEILSRLGNEHVDFVVDAGVLPEKLPSTVVDVSGEKAVILREGPISRSEIESVA